MRIGEVLDARQRKCRPSLSGAPTASFEISRQNAMADEIIGRLGKVLLTVYQGSTPIFTGECTDGEKVGQDGGTTITCNFLGPLGARLQKRLTGKVPFPGDVYTSSSHPNGRGQIAQAMLDTTNAEKDTGVRAGTVATLHPTTVGPVYYQPIAEQWGDMATARVYPYENPSFASHTYRDGFAHNLNSDLTGVPMDAPGGRNWSTSWTGAGDYHIYPFPSAGPSAGVVGRNHPGSQEDFANAGLASISGPIYAHVDFSHNAIENNLSGVFVRGTGTTDALIGQVLPTPAATTVAVVKRIGGVTAPHLVLVETAPIDANVIMSLRLHVEADGRWFLWYFPFGEEPVFPFASGQDTDLAPGGPLATGTIGMYDIGVTGQLRAYWSFRAKAPSTAMTLQGFEYELVPCEPLVDGSGVKIATWNVSARIGTDRPNVIFEWGTGDPTMETYQHLYSREGMLTQAYTLTDQIVNVSRNATAIATEGLYEEVVSSSLADAGLRQAFTDAHVAVRKQTRQTVAFTPSPSPNAPKYATDYFVGDTVTARILERDSTGAGAADLDATVRVYACEISIDEEGKVTERPILVQE